MIHATYSPFQLSINMAKVTATMQNQRPETCWHNRKVNVKGKGCAVTCQASIAGGRVSPEWEWVVTATPRTLCPWKRKGVPVVKEAGWVSRPARTNPENLAQPGFEPRTVQPVASRYTENFTILNTNIIHARSVEIYVKLSLQKNPNSMASDGVTPTSHVRLASKTK
jgi:hypothetical protein